MNCRDALEGALLTQFPLPLSPTMSVCPHPTPPLCSAVFLLWKFFVAASFSSLSE